MRTRVFLIVVLFYVGLHSVTAQKRTVGAIGFYNVENLFDTSDDPNEEDEEFTPTGRNKWDERRYASKKQNIAKVLSEMANGPDIIGLAEVENLFVIQELISHPTLKKHNYQIIHKDSPSWRGIDCALIYKPTRFKILDFEAIRFPDENYRTRDILYVKGIYFGDTLHIFVNHWPSRRGGKAERRIEAAGELRRAVDKILISNKEAKIVVMGDFNDDPFNKSVKKELRAVGKLKGISTGDLYNVTAPTFKQGYGTLFYKGAWSLFDQIIVSQGLLSKSAGISYQKNSFSIFGPNWMRVKEGQFAGGPKRSFGFGVYLNGYSDHFPTYILIEK